MNRILLGFVCCSSLLFNLPAQSVELIGPNDEAQIPQQSVEVAPTPEAVSVTTTIIPTKYGPIKSSETLWSISNNLRPNNNVSVYQTLAAIYKSNPSAFHQGDINKIIESSVINIPSAAFIAQQSNAEAYALLKPAPKVTKPAPTKPLVITTVVPTQVETPKKVESTFVPIDKTNVDLLKKDLENKELTLNRNEQQVVDQEKELNQLNEQLIIATEANQRLKLKLQPLSDQIASLSAQVEEDLKVQKELQALIDQYKAQIDAIEEPPFSGPGILNTILRIISSSTSILIFAILFPLLLLTGIFLLILRLKSKRELALRQQELAESTAILSEEKSEFDTLLDDDLDIEPLSEEVDDSDFIVDVSTEEPEEKTLDENDFGENNVEESLVDQQNEVEETVDTELIDQTSSEVEQLESDAEELNFDLDAMIEGSDDVIDLSEADLDLEETDQRDLDLAAQWEAELAQAELEENNGAAQEDITESVLNELQATETTVEDNEQEPIELDLTNETVVDETSIDDLDESSEVVVGETVVDELEELSESIVEEANELDELSEPVEEALVELEELSESVVEEALVELEELSEPVDEETVYELEELPESLIEEADELGELSEPVEEALVELEELSKAVDEEAVELEELSEPVEETVIELEELPESFVEETVDELEELSKAIGEEAVYELEELPESVGEEAIDELEELSKAIDEEAIDELEELSKAVGAETSKIEEIDSDSLAKQLSNNAFNENVELPSFDKNDNKKFIDIDTLLTGNEAEDVTEEDFNLEFGLDEFPDVVDSFTEFDTDADGVAAQLDLAHAYLEIDEKEGAKDILNQLLETAPEEKLKEVKKLLARIS